MAAVEIQQDVGKLEIIKCSAAVYARDGKRILPFLKIGNIYGNDTLSETSVSGRICDAFAQKMAVDTDFIPLLCTFGNQPEFDQIVAVILLARTGRGFLQLACGRTVGRKLIRGERECPVENNAFGQFLELAVYGTTVNIVTEVMNFRNHLKDNDALVRRICLSQLEIHNKNSSLTQHTLLNVSGTGNETILARGNQTVITEGRHINNIHAVLVRENINGLSGNIQMDCRVGNGGTVRARHNLSGHTSLLHEREARIRHRPFSVLGDHSDDEVENLSCVDGKFYRVRACLKDFRVVVQSHARQVPHINIIGECNFNSIPGYARHSVLKRDSNISDNRTSIAVARILTQRSFPDSGA